jgi:hypothetical protein
MAGCETLQTNIPLHIEERNIPPTLNPYEFQPFFSAGVQKVVVAFKEHSLK